MGGPSSRALIATARSLLRRKNPGQAWVSGLLERPPAQGQESEARRPSAGHRLGGDRVKTGAAPAAEGRRP